METINVGAAIFAAALAVLAPILFILYVFRFRKLAFHLPDVLMGIIVSWFAQTVLFSLIVRLVPQIPGLSFLSGDQLAQQLLYGVAGAVCLLGGWLVVWATTYQRRFSEGQVSRLTVGASVIKILSDIMSAAISNVTVALRISDGTLEGLLAQSVNNPAVDAAELAATYESYTPAQYLYLGILAILVIQTTYLVLLQIAEGKPAWQPVVWSLAFSFVYNFTYSIPIPNVMLVVAMALAIAELVVISRIMGDYLARKDA